MDDEGIRRAFLWWSGGDEGRVGERAWRDLALGAVFAKLDRCRTSVGQALLYRRLRMPATQPAPLADLERRAGAFASDGALGEHFGRAVAPLGGSTVDLARILYGEVPAAPRGARFYPLATVATIASLALAFVWPIVGLIALGCLLANIALRLGLHRAITLHASAASGVADLVSAARRVAALRAPALEPELGAIRHALDGVSSYGSALGWSTLDLTQLNEFAAIVVAYANMVLLLDVHAYVRTIALVRRARASLVTLYETIGELDAAQSIAAFRAATARWSRPVLEPAGAPIEVRGLIHPLVEDAVPNDVVLGREGWLVTGSNMSGKSTFLRAVATNAILAQAIGTTTCDAYRAPFLQVRTLIHVEDDVRAKESHFLVEARVTRDILVEEAAGLDRLVVVDELFRGTNTVDRVAAGTAFLRALSARGAFVVAATHDAELIESLAGQYRPHFFRETIEDGRLAFDYRIHAGALAPRNALAVLALVGYPEDVLAEARARASA